MTISGPTTGGWSLEEAMRATLDDAVFEAIAELEADHDALERLATAAVNAVSHWQDDDLGRSEHARSIANKASEKLELAKRNAWDAFRKFAASGSLVAIGRPNGANGATQIIESDLWLAFTQYAFPSSAVADAQQTIAFHSVRVFPLIDSPDAHDRLAGLTLRAAFQLSVLGDVEVQKTLRKAIMVEPELQAIMNMEGSATRYWPVDYSSADFPRDWRGLTRLLLGTELDLPEVLEFGKLTKRKFGSFMELLRRGKLRASGLPTLEGQRQPIETALWRRGDLWIDFREGDLARMIDTETFEPKFLSVDISVPPTAPSISAIPGAAPFDADETDDENDEVVGDDENQSGKPGRPKAYNWLWAYDRLFMVLLDNGFPESGEALVEIVREFFTKARRKAPSAKQTKVRLRNDLPSVWNWVTRSTR